MGKLAPDIVPPCAPDQAGLALKLASFAVAPPTRQPQRRKSFLVASIFSSLGLERGCRTAIFSSSGTARVCEMNHKVTECGAFWFPQAGNQLGEKSPLHACCEGIFPDSSSEPPGKACLPKNTARFLFIKNHPQPHTWLLSLSGSSVLLHLYCPTGPWRGSTLSPTLASDGAAFLFLVSILCQLYEGGSGSKFSWSRSVAIGILFFLTTVWALMKHASVWIPASLHLVRMQSQAEASPFQKTTTVLQSGALGSERELFFT